ncbi:MAG: putative membrane transporter protein [Candidatus Thorarchaeota archaeon]|nr:MAG: putative membrane transporter protein [Candidatus Thorarchaeota archaeon]
MLVVFLVLFILSFICEYAAATLGMGYGTTLAPLLLIAGYAPLVLVPVILFSQFFAGFIAAGFHHKFENMDLKDNHQRSAITIFTITGIIGVVVSILASISLPSIIVKTYIAITVILVGILTFVDGGHHTPYSQRKLAGLGILAAFNKGMSGGGYGPITTAGQMISGIPPRAAIAITALVEGIICIIGVILYYLLAAPVDLLLLASVTAGGIVAAPLSAFTTKTLKQESVKKAVAIAIILIGIVSLFLVIIYPVS